jgi:predicted nucleic acid-binding Zn ribbon protein
LLPFSAKPFVFSAAVRSAGLLDIHFAVGTSYERAAPLAEKNAAAGLSDFSVCGAVNIVLQVRLQENESTLSEKCNRMLQYNKLTKKKLKITVWTLLRREEENC